MGCWVFSPFFCLTSDVYEIFKACGRQHCDTGKHQKQLDFLTALKGGQLVSASCPISPASHIQSDDSAFTCQDFCLQALKITHTEVSKSSSAKERLLQLIQLTETQQHSDSSLTQSQSLLSGKVMPSSRGSRAVHVLLRFALSLSVWLTFLDAACVRSRLAPGNWTESSEPFSNPARALLATLVAILGMILCVNRELLLLGSRNCQGIYKEGQHISIGKSSRKSPFQ